MTPVVWRWLRPLALLVPLVTAGCYVDWLKTEEYDFPEGVDDPCALLCDDAKGVIADVVAECEVTCMTGPEQPYYPDRGVAQLDNPDFVGPTYAGGTCYLVVDCGDPNECQQILINCMWGTNDLDELQSCYDQYQGCVEGEECDDELLNCYNLIQEGYEACDADATNFVETLACSQKFELDAMGCECLYTACVDGADTSHCADPFPGGGNPSARQLTPNVWVVPRAMIDAQLRRLDGLDNEVTMTPLRDRETGALTGIRLDTITEADVVHSLGLRSGDILLSVGGLSPFSTFEEFRGLYDEPSVRATILRDGEVRQLTYLLRGPGRGPPSRTE